jgi:hypothetical protein
MVTPCPVINIHGTLEVHQSESATTTDNTDLHSYVDSLQYNASRVLQQFVMHLVEIHTV